jgi:diacylglycerol kinase family enzyme
VIDRANATPALAAIVYNPIKVDIDRVRTAVQDAAARAGDFELLWLATSIDDEGQGQTRLAIESGATLVIVAGGDGTVRAVAEALHAHKVELALIPSGTGNLLARNIGVSHTSLFEACSIAFNGDTRAIDIGLARVTDAEGGSREHAFLVMAGLGIDATMIANTRPLLKRRLGWLAYVDAGFRALPGTKKVRVGYALDGGASNTAHVSTILVANCGNLPGNIELIPDALVDDGMLDIAVLQPKSIFGWLMIWRRITWENRVLRKSALGQRIIRMTARPSRTELTYLRGESVRLTVDDPEPFELDGDEFGDIRAVDLRVDQQALMVKVPAAR